VLVRKTALSVECLCSKQASSSGVGIIKTTGVASAGATATPDLQNSCATVPSNESDALHGHLGCTDENGFKAWN
jgi:hypothetical protein